MAHFHVNITLVLEISKYVFFFWLNELTQNRTRTYIYPIIQNKMSFKWYNWMILNRYTQTVLRKEDVGGGVIFYPNGPNNVYKIVVFDDKYICWGISSGSTFLDRPSLKFHGCPQLIPTIITALHVHNFSLTLSWLDKTYVISLWLTPYDFTRQGESTIRERI